jgi:hypothetical protein
MTATTTRNNKGKPTTAEADAEIYDFLFEQSRLVIRSRGGLIDTPTALKEVLNDPTIKEKLLNHLETHGDKLDKEFVARWRASPEKTIAWLDAELALAESPD